MSEKAAEKFEVLNPRQYIELDVVKSNYAPSLPNTIFFKRGGNGLLEHAPLAVDRLNELARRLVDCLADSEAQGTTYSRRELVSQPAGKTIAAQVGEGLTGFNRRVDMPAVITYGLEQKLLCEVKEDTAGRGRARWVIRAGEVAL